MENEVEEIYKSIVQIEEYLGHENIDGTDEEMQDIIVTLDWLIEMFEQDEDYMRCDFLNKIKQNISNKICKS